MIKNIENYEMFNRLEVFSEHIYDDLTNVFYHLRLVMVNNEMNILNNNELQFWHNRNFVNELKSNMKKRYEVL